MKAGDKIWVNGGSDELWIEDYNCNVNTGGVIEVTPQKNDKKVLVILDNIEIYAARNDGKFIDGEGNVCCRVRKSKIRVCN